MLARNDYPREYIDGCRARVRSHVAVYRGLAAAARKQVGASSRSLQSALGSLEPVFFNNMVLVLDSYFAHRTRTLRRSPSRRLGPS